MVKSLLLAKPELFTNFRYQHRSVASSLLKNWVFWVEEKGVKQTFFVLLLLSGASRAMSLNNAG